MNLKASITVSEFWQYSLHFYSQNDNQAALLWLQDNAGLNVNCVLLLLYLQTKNVYISLSIFNHLIKENQKLDSLTFYVREKRRALKASNIANGMIDFRSLDYRDLLNQELDLEKQQQAALIADVLTFTKKFHTEVKGNALTNMNIKNYLSILKADIDNIALALFESNVDVLINEQEKYSTTIGNILDE